MPDLLPTLFIVLGACALVLTLFWLWQSLRQAFSHADEAPALAFAGSQERAALLAEKHELLVALKDLESERDGGKLSDADYHELNARYRERAREVLKALDAQLAPHREAARALLQGSAAPVAADKPAANSCASCSTPNDGDAVFCKKCGARLQQEAG
ncbi:MAG TPA: zinc ribbon domain-containing protein [Polyangiales bacterium]|nr:zinc ribbon domain-containing protein [Polyangiales bacterium]